MNLHCINGKINNTISYTIKENCINGKVINTISYTIKENLTTFTLKCTKVKLCSDVHFHINSFT